MKKLSKRNLNAILALLLAFNLSGCSLFGGDDEENDSKETATNKDNQKEKEKNKEKENKDKEDKTDNVDVEEDNHTINYTGGSIQQYNPVYPPNSPSDNQSQPEIPTKPIDVVKTDFSELHALIVEYKDMDISVYTPKSRISFNQALAHAEKILNTASASQKIVNEEVKALKQAKEKLVLMADFTKLSDALNQANNVDTALFTPVSVQSLQNIIESAQKVYNDKNSTQEKVNQAVASIQQGMNGLVKRADFSDLSNLIALAENINDDEYTDESLSPMYQSLEQAKAIKNNLNASQKAVDEITKDLQAKLDALVEYKAPDTSELKELIKQAKTYQENEYSTSSFKILKEGIKQAENTLSIRKVTEIQVQSATDTLQKAINGLNVDTSLLNKQLTSAKALTETDYTPSSYAVLKQAITDTENFLSDTHKQYEIDEQTKLLSNAMNQLVKRADKKDLQKAITDAKSKYDGDYTEVTLNALKDTVTKAEVVLNDLNASQDQVSVMTKSVNDAIANLKFAIHKEKLVEVIEKTKDVKEEDYTPNTYSPFKTAYNQAVYIYQDENATQEQVNACVNALETTFAHLVKRADMTVLNQKISEVEAIDQDDYTDESLVLLNKELNEAKELVKNLNATQDEVDAKLSSLSSAISSLVAYVTPNMDAINQAISDAESVKQDDWSATSYDAMKKKLDFAKEMVAKKKVTQEEIDKAKDELLSAYQALSVDLSELNTTLNNAKSYQEVNYTLDSFKVLTDAITYAEDFLKTSHTQSEINSELSNLQSAIDQLVLFHEADKTALTKAINDAKALNENEYTPNSYSPFKDAITKAETVKNKYRATVEEINNVINELDVAKANLVKRADVAELNQAIIEAKGKYTEGYTTSSLNALKQAVTEAESILSNANATQNEVDIKVNEINNAINSLVKIGDKTALSNLIDELEALQETDYTPISWASASLGSVIDDAKVIRDKTEATETEVNNALDALTQAKAKLVKKADITELETEIAKAKVEVSKAYTAQSLNELNQAITTAESVVNNANASAQEVSNALNTIKNALSKLRVDVTPLVQVINQAKAVDTAGKKPSTVTALNEAIKKAETLKDDSSITFEQMNAMIEQLKNAVNNLQDMTDTSALVTKINEAKAVNKNDYTTNSYAKLETVLQEAITALDDEDITPDEVSSYIQKLEDAVNNLVYQPTVSGKRNELEKVVAEAEALLNDTTIQGPSNLKSLLQEYVGYGNELLERPENQLTIESIQQHIDYIKTYMQNYKDNLYDVQGLIVKAQAKLAEFKALNPDDWSSASYNTVAYYAQLLEERIAIGEYVGIKNAYDWLADDMENLEPKDTKTYVNEQAPGEVLALLNAERKAQGLGELTLDPTLCKATTIRATEAHEQKGDFADWAHKRPNGDTWFTVLDEVGFSSSLRGENAARGQADGESLYNAWYNSEGHRNNMMNPNFTKVGISMVKVGEGAWVSYMILSD